jgi:two-component system alkaline phosphatase synthesis response regulator PhoP
MNQGKKVLFIEDDSLIVKIYKVRLELEGYTVTHAEDGEEGFKKYLNEQPDLIVLDLMIPKLSGIDLLKKIREQNKQIPIIVYSVLHDKERIKNVKALGASDYFIKADIHPKRLVERIKSYLV